MTLPNVAAGGMERFMGKAIPEPNSGCWLWLAGLDRDGYGRFWMGLGGGLTSAHRAAWLLFRGDPGRLHVLHKCDTPLCVNPDHLFLGTNLDNVKDRDAKGRGRGRFGQGRSMPLNWLNEPRDACGRFRRGAQ